MQSEFLHSRTINDCLATGNRELDNLIRIDRCTSVFGSIPDSLYRTVPADLDGPKQIEEWNSIHPAS
jgi:hypothetical protein